LSTPSTGNLKVALERVCWNVEFAGMRKGPGDRHCGSEEAVRGMGQVTRIVDPRAERPPESAALGPGNKGEPEEFREYPLEDELDLGGTRS
jgi:hypothetical protein